MVICNLWHSRDCFRTVISTDCVAADNFNAGCAVGMDTNSSYGPRFNDIGGGWYAVERTSYFISVWFWARTDDSVPLDVSYPTLIINTDKWGTPSASFPNTDCDIASEFDPNNIIINLTFCSFVLCAVRSSCDTKSQSIRW